jgi:aldehyde:ferredoxin oxidoreductase
VFELQNKRAVVDSLGVCVIGTRAIGLEEMVRILEVTVGLRVTQAELLGIGERIYNLERLLAVREGTSRKDDTLPPRIFEETLKSGPAADIRLERVKFESMLDEYYELRDWDRGGKPTETKLKGLGIPKLLGQWNEG